MLKYIRSKQDSSHHRDIRLEILIDRANRVCPQNGSLPKIYFSFYQSHCPVYYIVSNLCALKYIVQNVLKKFPSVRNPKSFPKTTLLFSFINS